MADRHSGGVRNIRAMFEARQDAEPPSRSRSPAGSELSEHSRPRSKVRASFVSVEGKSGQSASRTRDMDGTASDGGDGGRLSITSDPRSGDANGSAIGRSPSLGRVREENVAKESNAGGSDGLQAATKDIPAPIEQAAKPKDQSGSKTSPSKSKPGATPSKASPVKEAARTVEKKASELKSKVEAKAAAVKPSTASSKPSSKPGTTPASARSSKPMTSPKDSSKAANINSSTTAAASKTTTLPSRTNRLSTASTKAAPGSSKPTTTSRPSAATARAEAPKKESRPSVGGFVKPAPRSPTKPVQLPAGAKATTTSSSAKLGRQSLAGDSASRASGVGVARTPSARTSTAGSLATSRASLAGHPKPASAASTKPTSSAADATRKVSGPTSSRSSGVGIAAKAPIPSKATTTKPSVTKPTSTRPTAARPAAATSASSKPASMKPATTKPAVTKPVAGKPTAARSTETATAIRQSLAKSSASKAATSKAAAPAAAAKKDTVGSKPAVARAMGAKAAADRVVKAQATSSEAIEAPATTGGADLQPPVGEPPLASATKEAIAPGMPAEPEHGGELEPTQEPPPHAPEVVGSLPERKPSKSEVEDFAQTNQSAVVPSMGLTAPTQAPAEEPLEVKSAAVEPKPDAAPKDALISPAPEPEPKPQELPKETIAAAAPLGTETKPDELPKEATSAAAPSEPEFRPQEVPKEAMAVVAPPEPEPKPQNLPKEEPTAIIPPTGAESKPQELPKEEAAATMSPTGAKPKRKPPKLGKKGKGKGKATPVESEPEQQDILSTETTKTLAPPAEPEPPLAPETSEAIAPEKPTQAKLDDIAVDTPIEAALSPPNSAVAEALAEPAPKPRGPAPKLDVVKQQAVELEMAANELAQIDSAAPAPAPELSHEPRVPALQQKPSGGSGRSEKSRPSLHRESSAGLRLPEAATPSKPTAEEIEEHRRQSTAAEEMHKAEKPPMVAPQESVPEEAVQVDEAVGAGKKAGGEDLLVDL